MSDRTPPSADAQNERLILADDVIMRAVIAWKSLPKHSAEGPGLVSWSPGVFYDWMLWMKVAGLDSSEHGTISARCRTLGFIETAGEVWPPLLVVVKAEAARRLKKLTNG